MSANTATPVICAVCGSLAHQLSPGPAGRPLAACGTCGSLERHRFLYLLLRAFEPQAQSSQAVLDVAPSTQLSASIEQLNPAAYVSIDFDPKADGRFVRARASLTDLPLRSASVGLMVCYHVLEHIPDDHRAMLEIRRVLSPKGVALVQVPRRPGPTDEDPSATPAERVRRFGQADHVRYYGDDFESRLTSAGLAVATLVPEELLSLPACSVLGINPKEQVWLCSLPGQQWTSTEAVRKVMSGALEHLLTRVASVWAESTPPDIPTVPALRTAPKPVMRSRSKLEKFARRQVRKALKTLHLR